MTDHHVRWCNYNGEHHMFIISFIRLMLNLSVHVPRPCLYMLGSPNRTLVFACVKLSYTVVCKRRVYHTRSSRGASKRRTFLTVHTKEEHIIILILKRGIIL